MGIVLKAAAALLLILLIVLAARMLAGNNGAGSAEELPDEKRRRGIRGKYERSITRTAAGIANVRNERVRGAKAKPAGRITRAVIRKNRQFNEQYPAFAGYIGKQSGGGPADSLRYGIFRMSFNGCEVIAVYNLLKYFGKDTDIRDVAAEIAEKGHVLLGGFGTRPDSMRDYLEDVLVEERRHGGIFSDYKARAMLYPASRKEDFDAILEKNEAGILTFWNGERKWSIHTVMLHRTEKGGIRVYNQYTNVVYCEYASVEHFLRNQGRPYLPISLIVIQKQTSE